MTTIPGIVRVNDRAERCSRIPRLQQMTLLSVVFASTLLLAGDVEGIQPLVARHVVLLLLAFVVFASRGLVSLRRAGRAGVACSVVGLGLLFTPHDPHRWLVGSVLLLTGFARGTRDVGLSGWIPIFVALDAVRRVAFELAPGTWRGFEAISLSWSAWIGGLVVEEPIRLGSGILGLSPVVMCATLVVTRFVVIEWRPLRALAVLFAAAVAHGLALAYFFAMFPNTPSHAAAAWLARWIWIPAACIVVGMSSIGMRRDRRDEVSSRLRWRRAAAIPVAGLLACGVVVSDLATRESERRILFYSRNEGPILQWNRPTYDEFGPFAHGMFGLLPEYLERDGYEIAYLRKEIEPEDLTDVDVFVTINASTDWDSAELEAVWSFVRRGGSLLVLGDHTDVEGSQDSQNRLLEPTGIRFRFDGAVGSPLGGWTGSELAFHPLTSGVAHGGQLGISVGASLDLEGSRARPLVLGSCGLSDVGDRNAPEHAFLGNYECDPGEQVGDLVLVAESKLGKGRVVVFGDTSSFQNPSLLEGYDRFVRRVFSWTSASTWHGLRPVLAGLSLVGFAVLIGFLVSRRSSWTAGPITVVCLVVPLVGAKVQHGLADTHEVLRPSQVAWIDLSHGARVDFASTGKNPISALTTNLMRAGFTVRLLESFDLDELEPGDVLLLLAPVVEYSTHEVREIEAFADRGGGVIAAAGARHEKSIARLLDRFSLGVGDTPVGPVPFERSAERVALAVEYVEAWPVLLESESDRVGALVHDRNLDRSDPARDLDVYGFFRGVPLAVLRRKGKGGLFLVADSYFFSDENLEGSGQPRLPNVYLLRRVLSDLSRAKGIES